MSKKAIIVPLIVGGVMVVLGGTIAAISAASAGGISFLSTAEPYVERHIDVASSTVNINVNEVNNKIVVNKSSTVTEVSFSVYENTYEYYVTSETDTDFTIDYHNDIPWNKKIFYYPVNSRTMTITIPENYQGSLDINTTNAIIDVNDISVNGEINLESVNGLITVDNTFASGKIVVHTTNSKIELQNVTTSNNLSATSINALIRLEDIQAVDVTIQTTNGRIDAEDIESANMSLTTTNGQVIVSDIDVDAETRLITTNGEVRGDVKGPSTDYDVDSQTTNGTNNLAGYNAQVPSTGDKLLYVRSYNGAINITFK